MSVVIHPRSERRLSAAAAGGSQITYTLDAFARVALRTQGGETWSFSYEGTTFSLARRRVRRRGSRRPPARRRGRRKRRRPLYWALGSLSSGRGASPHRR